MAMDQEPVWLEVMVRILHIAGALALDKTCFQKGSQMKEPGLDNRHRDQDPPKAGQIQQKRGDTLNENLPEPIEQFRPTLPWKRCGRPPEKTSIEDVRKAAKRLRT